MKFAALFFALFCLIASAMAVSQAELRSQFGSFITKYNRFYQSAEEMEARFQIFTANMAQVEEYNKESKSAKFGMTRFSDWSPKERETFLGKLPTDRNTARKVKTAKQVEPQLLDKFPAFDFKADKSIQPIKDQGQCGSCWAFSTVFGVAAAGYNAGYSADVAFNLAQQQIVDCDNYDGGCNGGDLPSAFEYLQQAGGLMSSADYPYHATDGNCKFNGTKVQVPVDDFEWVIPTCENSSCDQQSSVQAATNIVAKGFAPSICVYVANSWFDYDSGVFDLKCANGYNVLNHCVGLSAMYQAADGSIVVEIANSWGTSWGEQGYMRLKLDSSSPNRCGVLDEMTFAVVPQKQ